MFDYESLTSGNEPTQILVSAGPSLAGGPDRYINVWCSEGLFMVSVQLKVVRTTLKNENDLFLFPDFYLVAI